MSRCSLHVVTFVAIALAVWLPSRARAAISPFFVNNFNADTPNTGDRIPNSAFQWKQDYVHTQTYDENGGMSKPTFASQSGDSGAAATAGGNYSVNSTLLSGFSTNNVAIFTHPSRFGGNREGIVQVRNGSGQNNPFAGTNTGGYVFDFDLSLAAESKQETSTWTVKPYIALQSNFGTDGINLGYKDLIRVRWDNGNIVLDHAAGTTTLVTNYTALTPYHIEAQVSMDTDQFNIVVNGVTLGTYDMLFAGNSTRGIGGYEIRGGQPDDTVTSGTFEGFLSFYDNISFAVPEPSCLGLLALAGVRGLRRNRRLAA